MQKNAKILGATLASALIVGAATAMVVGVLADIPDFTPLKSSVPVPIRLADGRETARNVGPRAPGWVPISQISNYLIMAVIASEDTTFFSHSGIDFHELTESIKKDLKEKRWARGASTITQQVIKNVYLDPAKTVTRKITEILWARELEKSLSKSQILCFYLNMVEWGPGIYGAGAAAQHYFHVPPSEVTPKQAAFLAMLIPSPVKYHTYFEAKKLTDWAAQRVDQILRVMNRMGFVDEAAYNRARNESLWGESPLPEEGASVDKLLDREFRPEPMPIPQPEPTDDRIFTPAIPPPDGAINPSNDRSETRLE